jgi:hypothetical protein
MIAIQILGVVYVDSFNRRRRIHPFDPDCSATRPTLFEVRPGLRKSGEFWLLIPN